MTRDEKLAIILLILVIIIKIFVIFIGLKLIGQWILQWAYAAQAGNLDYNNPFNGAITILVLWGWFEILGF